MGTLDRYILRKIAVPAALAFVVVSFLAMIGGIRNYLEIIPLDLVTVGDLSRISLFSLPSLVGYVIPFSFMLGILAAFGRMAQNHELIVMKAAGIPLKRVVLPVILCGAALSALSFLVQDRVQPWAVRQVLQLIYSDVPLRASIELLPAGVMHEFGGWRVYVGEKDPRTGTLYNLVLLKPEEDGGAAAYYAQSARLEREDGQSLLVLRDGRLIPPDRDGRMMPIVFERSAINVPRLAAREAPPTRQAMTLDELFARQRALGAEYERSAAIPVMRDLIRERNELSDRLAFPLMCLAFALAAAPLGARAPKAGRSYIFAAGFCILVIYFTLRSVLQPTALHPLHEVVLRGQAPNLLLAAIGAALLWRVDRV